MRNRLLPLLGSGFWVLGLILFLVGLNIHAAAGTWLTSVGSIFFLAGLGLEGVWWFLRRRDASDQEEQ